MSLIIGLCYKDQFVMASNDSKVTIQYHDENYKKTSDKIIETDLKEEKVDYLTENVLLCVSGLLDACNLIKSQLKKRVNPTDDLTKCGNILEKLINDLKSGLVSGLTKEEKQSIKILESTFFNCELVGFNKSTGATGLVRYNPFASTLIRMDAPVQKNGYPIFIDSPAEEDLAFQSYLDLPTNEQTLENFLNQFLMIHANLSHKHMSISSDCNFHILLRVGNEVKYFNKTIETSGFYEQLGLTKGEVEC